MGLPEPLTRRIADIALDALIVAERVVCPVNRESLMTALRQINSATDRLHTARKVARSIEDNGYASEWTHRHLRELERVGEIETIERRSLSVGTER